MATLHSRTRKGGQITGSPKLTPPGAVFDSTTGATPVGEVSDGDVTDVLALFPDVIEVGEVGQQEVIDAAGTATTVVTVPADKYWRLIGAVHSLTTDANVANRQVVYQTRQADDTAIGTAVTHATQAASLTRVDNTIFGLTNVGDAEDQAAAEDYPTAGPYLVPTDEIAVSVTLGEAGDDLTFHIFYIEYDNDPR